MVQFVEMEGKMNRNGCIEVPAAVLEQAGIGTGEAVKLFYMADRESLKNESREFMIFRADEGETARQTGDFIPDSAGTVKRCGNTAGCRP